MPPILPYYLYQNIVTNSLKKDTRLTRYTAAELVGELLDKVVVESVLQRSQYDDGSSVLQFFLAYSFVRENHILCLLEPFRVAGRGVPVHLFGLTASRFEGSQFGEVEATFAFGAERGSAATSLKNKFKLQKLTVLISH